MTTTTFAATAATILFTVACGNGDAIFGDIGGAVGSGGDVGTGATTSTSSSDGGATTANGGAGAGQGGASSQGGGGGAPKPCVWGADGNPCGDAAYCDAPDCMSGTCQLIPEGDDPIRDPICGCDGVNYWNATTAAQFGMSVASAGECAEPATCNEGGTGQSKDCPRERHSCAQLLSSVAACFLNPGTPRGVCWGMPAMCSEVTIGGTWRPCDNGTLAPCLDACEAIKDERAFYSDLTCPQ